MFLSNETFLQGTQILATMFKEAADKFFDKLQLGKVQHTYNHFFQWTLQCGAFYFLEMVVTVVIPVMLVLVSLLNLQSGVVADYDDRASSFPL
jgi:hypothetical protein